MFLGDVDDEDYVHHGLFSETLLRIDGKTILQPLREEQEATSHLDSDDEEGRCACPCCTSREAKFKHVQSLVEDLRWRAEIAEAEKHKYQNQIYTIRKKVETRITPFRDMFDEVRLVQASGDVFPFSLSVLTYNFSLSMADV